MSYSDRLPQRHARPIGTIIGDLVTSCYPIGVQDLFVEHRTGRPRHHPGWVPIVYCALVRHFESCSRLDAELATGLWQQLRTAAIAAGLDDPGSEMFMSHHHRYWRDLIMEDPDSRDTLRQRFTQLALQHATGTGLLLPGGKGSRTHPHLERVMYGDGTIVRPKFTPAKCERDPSAEQHGRFDGLHWGNNFVMFATRGDSYRSRIILDISRVATPGTEAATAVNAIAHIVSNQTSDGIVAVAYDGALRGTHINNIMTNSGLVVINKPHAASNNGNVPVPSRKIIGHMSHDVDGTECVHLVAAINGRLAVVELDENGEPTPVAFADRHQIKRSTKADGTFRFSLGVTFHCRHHDITWTKWVNPHEEPEHIRLIPPDDPDFNTLYGRRPDAESLNAEFKRTLIADRASSIGWERQLYDLYGFAVLHNSGATRQ